MPYVIHDEHWPVYKTGLTAGDFAIDIHKSSLSKILISARRASRSWRMAVGSCRDRSNVRHPGEKPGDIGDR